MTINPVAVRSALLSYGVPVLAVLAASVLLAPMEAYWRISTPVPFFLIAVIVSAWLGGTKSGVVAIVLSLVSFAYLYLPTAAPGQFQAVRLTTFLTVASFVVWLTTRQKRTAESLRQVADTIPVMAWSVLPDGKVDFLNRRWLEYAGLSMEQGLADPTASIHPEDRARAGERWVETMRSGGTYEEEMRLRRADGEYRWFLVRTVPLRDAHGTILRWFGTSTDIEDHKRAETSTRESQELLHRVLATLPVGVTVTDQAGDAVLANEASNRIWGGTIVSGAERWERSKGRWHESGEEIRPQSWASARALSSGEISSNELIDIETFDGKHKTIENSVAPVRDAQGRIVGAVIVNADVTERVCAEQELRESRERLQQLSRRLLAVQEEERRHLSRELHDEFGQTLAAIALHLQVAKNAAGSAAQPSLDESMRLLQQAGAQVRSLAVELRPTMLETAGLDGTLQWLAEQYNQRIGVVVEVVGRAGEVSAETAVAGFRVVQEALTNVIRHAQARRVWIELDRSDDALELEIHDDGVGFDAAATLDRAAHEGHLGLLGMKERVQILGGTLDVDSSPGEGTRIRVSLPAV